MAFNGFAFSQTAPFRTGLPAGVIAVGHDRATYGTALGLKDANGYGYGWISSGNDANGQNTFNDASGVDPRIGGYCLSAGPSVAFWVGLPNGTYNIQLPIGVNNGAGATCGYRIFAGQTTNATGTLLKDVHDIVVAAGQIVDTDGTITTFAAWDDLPPAETVQITVTGGAGITITQGKSGASGQPAYLHFFGYEPVADPLTAPTLTDDVGDALTEIHCNQPSGYPVARIAVASGAESFSLSGTLASYYEVQQVAGQWCIVAGSDRLPDDGAGTLTLIQTDADAPNSPLATDIIGGDGAVTITSSGGRDVRDGHWKGRIPTQSWLARQAILDLHSAEMMAEWDDSWTADATLTADSPTAFLTAWNSVEAGTRTRILLRDGIWDGLITLPALDMGSGHLLIEPDTGHDPLINSTFNSNYQPRGVQFRGCKFGLALTSGWVNQFQFGITLAATPLKMMFTDNRVGLFFSDDWAGALANWFDGAHYTWANFFTAELAEQVILRRNTFHGCMNVNQWGATRIGVFEDNDIGIVVGDVNATTQWTRPWRPSGLLTDDNLYISIRRNRRQMFLDKLDTAGLTASNLAHSDFHQIRDATAATGLILWAADTAVAAGAYRINLTDKKVYLYDAAGTTGDTVLSATSTGAGSITDGTATCHYVGAFAQPNVYLLMEDNLIVVQGETYFDDGTRFGPGIQFLIDGSLKETDWGVRTYACVFNNLVANTVSLGANAAGGSIDAGFNSFVGPPTTCDASESASTVMQSPVLKVTLPTTTLTPGGKVRSVGNVIGWLAGNQPNLIGAQVSSIDDLPVDFTTTAVSPYTPSDLLDGSFTRRADGIFEYAYAPDDIEANTKAVRESALSRIMHPLAGDAGARLTELWVHAEAGSTISVEVDS
jgi:hypothetical protein